MTATFPRLSCWVLLALPDPVVSFRTGPDVKMAHSSSSCCQGELTAAPACPRETALRAQKAMVRIEMKTLLLLTTDLHCCRSVRLLLLAADLRCCCVVLDCFCY